MAMAEVCDRHHTVKDVRKVEIVIHILAPESKEDGETHTFNAVLGPPARKLLIDRVKALIKPPVKAAPPPDGEAGK